MRKASILFAALVLLPLAASAAVTPGSTGVGLAIGDPLGPTLKRWLTGTQAVDVGLGLGGNVTLYGDYLWHGFDVIPKPERGRFAVYIGLGPRYEIREHHDDKFGVRFPGGLSYFVQGAPVELFGEIVPILEVAPDLEGDVDADVGVRVYIGGF
ncbi:MAG: hypothetical protein JO102_05625 [Elusimicrobia bacterium]|nr:hypothetical protein [Elusimicrobiota bacterium]